LHIVSFDVPYPANYGGVMDVFYKIKSLHQNGVKIHLHCFHYGRPQAPELKAFCETVTYYKRKTSLWSHFSLLPYTVRSRQSAELKKNLLRDNFPILFEVLHTTWLMRDKAFRGRFCVYRHSNIEHDYYSGLAKAENNPLNKVYLKLEAFKLKRYEVIIRHASLILAVNIRDRDYFKRKFPEVPCEFLPSFHPGELKSLEGTEPYVLFHGNLSVSENEEAAFWLSREVFPHLRQKVIVAGLEPGPGLVQQLSLHKNVELIKSPSEERMQQLIRQANIHVLYTAQATGLKLKLLNVLNSCGFVVCNPEMLEGTGLRENDGLYLAKNGAEFISRINQLSGVQMRQEQLNERKKLLILFDNQLNAKKLIRLVFPSGL
jgi:hypothetical protein